MLGPVKATRGYAASSSLGDYVASLLRALTAPPRGALGLPPSREEREGERNNRMLRIYEVVLDVVRDLNPVVATLERKNKDLANQLDRARTSIPLNLREGSHGRGKARAHRYSLASGSADECIAILDVAVACGYLAPQPELHTKLRHVIGTLMRCQK